jgi:hypothetical protein
VPAAGLEDTEFTIATPDGIYTPNADGSTIEFCNNGDTASDCRANAAGGITTKDSRHAIILKACDGVRAEDSGGLVRFEPNDNQIYEFAPIKCGGTCLVDGLDDINLDWGITFTAGVSDADNEFRAEQNYALYDGSADGLVKTAYLVEDTDVFGCKADGTMEGTVPTGVCVLSGDNGITKATGIQTLFETCGAMSNDVASAKIIQLLHVDAEGDNDDLRFCNSKSVSLEIKDMTGTAYDALAIAASTGESVPHSVFVSFDTIQYEKCFDGKYKLISSVNVDTTEIDGSWGFVQSSDAAVYTGVKVNNQIVFTSPCKTVCGGSGFTGQMAIGGDISWAVGDDTASLGFSINTQVLGDPCPKNKEISPGTVILNLYSVPVDGGSCQSSDPQEVTNAIDDKLCAKLTPSGFGNAGLQVTSELLQRVPSDMIHTDSQEFDFKDGAVPEVVTHPFFTHDTNVVVGDETHKSANARALALNYDDAFTTYRLVVDWKQELSQRRLRSVHVFGAGDHEALSSLTILPPSAQIQDAVESLDAASGDAGDAGGDAEPAAEESSKLKTHEVVWIAVGSLAGLALIGYVGVVVSRSSGIQLGVGLKRPGSDDYSRVRRSERFSTMKF